MDLNALTDFHLVARHGGLGKASRETGRPKATLSRRITELEEALGLRLLERGGRKLELTEAGQALLARTEGPMKEVAEAMAAAREGLAAPRGSLRIAAPLLLSQVALGRLAAKFRVTYPEVLIEVTAEDRVAQLVDEHFDVAIRINPSKDSALVGRCFAKDQLILAAAPSIPMPKGRPGKPVPVPAVVMPTYRNGEPWSVRNGRLIVDPQPVLRLSSLLTVRDAVLAGAGAALLPRSLIDEALQGGELAAWGMAEAETELWVLHTSRRLQSPKVKAFVDFMCAQYPDGRFVVGH